jgi:hypothetical protein
MKRERDRRFPFFDWIQYSLTMRLKERRSRRKKESFLNYPSSPVFIEGRRRGHG